MTDAIEGADGTSGPEKPELRAAPSPDDSEPDLQAMVRSEPESTGSEVLVRAAGPVEVDAGKVALTAAGRDVDQSQTANHVARDMYRADTINIYGVPEDGYAEAQAPIPLRKSLLDPEELARRADLVVPPSGLLDQLSILGRRRMLVFACAERMGQNSAAAYLLHELITSSEGVPADLSVEELDADLDFRWDQLLSDTGDPTALVVDLTTMPNLDSEAVVRGLGGLQEVLKRTGSFLVLAIPTSLGNRVARAFQGQVHWLQAPSGEQVFRRHLRDSPAAELLESLLANEWLVEQLREAPPPWVAELAGQIDHMARGGERRVEILVAQVRQASEEWSEELRTELAFHPDARWRADLAAAALLEGTRASSVAEAGRLLLEVSGFEQEGAHRLEQEGAVKGLEALATTTFDPRTTNFFRPAYGRSVLSHLWSEHPVLRRDLIIWMDRVPSQVPDLTGADLGRLADRVKEMASDVAETAAARALRSAGREESAAREADLAAAEGASIAIEIARRWAGAEQQAARGSEAHMHAGSRRRARDASRRSVAVRLLARGATDPTIGRFVRAQMYDWAYDNAATCLKVVVAQTCGSEFGVLYPRNAFTRLRHLAASPAAEVRAAVVAAVRRLWAQLGGSRVLGYLLDWFVSEPQGRLETVTTVLKDPELLAHLLKTAEVRHLTPVGPSHRTSVGGAFVITKLWRLILDTMSSEDVATLVSAWLGAVESSPPQGRTALVERLVQAAESDLRRIAQLLYATRRRSAALTQSDTVDDLFGQLRTRLDEIDPAAWAPGAKDLR